MTITMTQLKKNLSVYLFLVLPFVGTLGVLLFLTGGMYVVEYFFPSLTWTIFFLYYAFVYLGVPALMATLTFFASVYIFHMQGARRPVFFDHMRQGGVLYVLVFLNYLWSAGCLDPVFVFDREEAFYAGEIVCRPAEPVLNLFMYIVYMALITGIVVNALYLFVQWWKMKPQK